jgi:L-ribulose-5-phosphate 4-epimerase
MLKRLKEEVYKANITLVKSGLVTLTWGNVSGISRAEGKIVIKPSGVNYDKLTSADMVIVDLKGNVVEGKYRPSSDTATHVLLYSVFPTIGGIAHTHSTSATMFAQACREIPCFGTTHADHFTGPVPVTRFLTEDEVNGDYEGNTGKIIAERFASLDAVSTPGVLVAGHAPFTWGRDAFESVKNAIALENIAQMALGSLQLNPNHAPLPSYIQEKHFKRKHGPNAYYGQK